MNALKMSHQRSTSFSKLSINSIMNYQDSSTQMYTDECNSPSPSSSEGKFIPLVAAIESHKATLSVVTVSSDQQFGPQVCAAADVSAEEKIGCHSTELIPWKTRHDVIRHNDNCSVHEETSSSATVAGLFTSLSNASNMSYEVLSDTLRLIVEHIESESEAMGGRIDCSEVIYSNIQKVEKEIRKIRRKHCAKLYQRYFRKLKKQKGDSVPQLDSATFFKSIPEKKIYESEEENSFIHLLDTLLPRLQRIKRRYQCKRNQRRYRQRKLKEDIALQQDLKVLKARLCTVAEQRSHLQKLLQNARWNIKNHTDLDTQGQYQIKMVHDYMKLFKNGYYFEANPATTEKQKQLSFLRTHISPNIALMSGERGIENYIRDWELLRRSSDYVQLIIHRMSNIGENRNTVRIENDLHLRVTQRFIQNLFPHMVTNQRFLDMSLGKILKCECVTTFEFRGRLLIRHEFDLYMLSGWMKLLKDHKLVLEIMGKAEVTPEGYFIGSQEQNEKQDLVDC